VALALQAQSFTFFSPLRQHSPSPLVKPIWVGRDGSVSNTLISRCSKWIMTGTGETGRLLSGFGGSISPRKKKPKKRPFDVKSSLVKSELLYDRLEKEYGGLFGTVHEGQDVEWDENCEETPAQYAYREYIVSARSISSPQRSFSLSDWVPVSLLCTLTSNRSVSDLQMGSILREGIRSHIREILWSAESLSPGLLDKIERQSIEFAVEDHDEWNRAVYYTIVDPSSRSEFESVSEFIEAARTKSGARKVLNLDEGGAQDEQAKTSFRKLSIKFHPDNTQTGDPERFSEIKTAYTTLTTSESYETIGIRQGGMPRNTFQRVDLKEKSAAAAKSLVAVRGIDGDVTRLVSFLAGEPISKQR